MCLDAIVTDYSLGLKDYVIWSVIRTVPYFIFAITYKIGSTSWCGGPEFNRSQYTHCDYSEASVNSHSQ